MTREKLDQLIEYVTAERFSGEIQKAKKEYHRNAGEIFEDDKSYENRMTAFLEWYLFDYMLPEKSMPPLELFIAENRDKLTSEQIKNYESFLYSIHGIFIVKKIKEDHVVVYNMFDKNKYMVQEEEGSIFFHKNDIFEGRILLGGNNKYYFTGTFCYHPPDALRYIKGEIKKVVRERELLEKTLKKMNSDLNKIEEKLTKAVVEAERMKAKVEKSGVIHSDSLLTMKLSEIESRKTVLEEQRRAAQTQKREWEIEKITMGYRLTREHLIQKLSYMSLKWERSRQIALSDIYRNA